MKNEKNDKMTTHAEIIKTMLDQKGTKLTFEIDVTARGLQAALTVQQTPSVGSDETSFTKKWTATPTKAFVLALVTLLDKQAAESEKLSEAVAKTNKCNNESFSIVTDSYGLIQ